MSEQFQEKLLRILNMIITIQANPGITAKRLKQKYGVTYTTVRRDIDEISRVTNLQDLGRGKGYRFEEDFYDVPVPFTEDERSGIVLSLSLLNLTQNTIVQSLVDKFTFAKNKSISKRYDLIEEVSNILPTGKSAKDDHQSQFLNQIIRAALDKRTISATYHAQYTNQITVRNIDPYYLIPRDNRFYLIGYCHEKQAIRTFRINRFQKVKVTDAAFEQKEFDIDYYMEYTWNINRGSELINFKVHFSPKVARYIKEKELFVQPTIIDNPDGSVLFEVTVNHKDDFIKWVLQYGIEAEILEPSYIRVEMEKLLSKWTDIYK
ncbi:helix-turn-helix transcriptional regulator [Paenibacillus campi]|uniref:helix-turn-helix transcriptional regulator n=1 Tax=Paenibacillus campi TaxID=3106031 RepID=UPI002AFF1734|nr:WYL domain-containing protein [Paenibacillus sp. SGZ-1014]